MAITCLGLGLLEVAIAVFGSTHFSNLRPDASGRQTQISDKVWMQELMGVRCALSLWPGLLILDFAGIEPFELPRGGADVLSLALPAVMDTVYASALIIGISLTNPAVMAVAQLLVVPVGFVYDAVVHLCVTFMGVLGAVFILIGIL